MIPLEESILLMLLERVSKRIFKLSGLIFSVFLLSSDNWSAIILIWVVSFCQK